MNSSLLMDRFLKYLSLRGISSKSLRYYKSDLNQFGIWLNGRKISKNLIKLYINELSLTTPRSTINRRLSTLRAYSQFLKRDYTSSIENIGKNTILSKLSSYRHIQDLIIKRLENKDRLKKIISNIFYSRPKWYERYHSYPISNYLHFAILIIFSSLVGFLIYDRTFKGVSLSQAYPSNLTRPNRYLSFQGRLTTSAGNPITTATDVIFKLYNVSSGGSELWTSATCSITPDSDGIFSTLLGSSCGSEIDASVFSENASIWVGVTIGSDSEATPRVQIATVGYALNAETLQGYPAGTGVSNIPYINSSGTMLLANSSPKIESSSGTFSVEGQALTITTPNTSNGIITINPDGTGTLDLTFEGASAGGSANGFINATNANITSGSLYAGTVASAATGYNFINFLSGAVPSSKFSVNDAGNTTMAGDLTITGDDLYMATNTAGMILVADGTNFNPTAVSGDITINGSGVTAIGSDKVTEAMLKVVDSPSDEECLTYESTAGDFEWQSCGTGGGMTSFTLAGDSGVNQTISDTNTLTVAGGTNGIDTVGGATDTVTLNLDTTEIGSTTFGSGAGITWTFDASAGTDTSIAFGDNSQTFTTATGTYTGNLVVQGTTGLTFNTGAGGDITFANSEKIDNDTDGTIAITAPTTSLSGDLKLTGADILDTNGNEFLRFTSTASAVDEITIANAAANGIVTLAATGGDTDIALSIDSKGADSLNLNGTATGDVNIAGGSGSTGCTIANATGNLTCSGTISGTITATSMKWNGLTNPDGALTLAHATNATTMGWTGTGALDAWTMNNVNNASSGTQNFVSINQAVSTGSDATDNLLLVQQLDTTASGTTGVTNAIKIDVAANSGMTNALTVTNSAGNLTTGINIADTAGGTLTTGISLSGTFTTGIDMGNSIIANIGNANTDFDTSGGLTLAGNLVVQGTTGLTFNTGAGGDITFANSEKIDNDTDGTVLISSPITSLSGDLVVQGGDIDNSAGTSTIALNSNPANVNSYHKLYNGSWLVQNSINNGIAALMIDQTKGGDIFSASASGTMKFKVTNTGVLTLANDETIDNTTNGTINLGTTIFKLTGGTSAVTDQTTFDLFNTTTTTLNVGGAATTALNLGNGSGNYTAINLGSGSGTHTINIAGSGATAADTINIGTGGTAADTINIGSSASTTALNLTSGTGAQTFTSSVATGTTTGSAFVFNDTSLTSGVLNYLTSSSVTTGKLLDITTGTANTWTGNGTTSGLVNIASSSTAGTASASDILLNLSRSGANSNTAHTAYGLYSSVTNTNVTSGTNIAGYFSASGATTANYGLIVENGNVGIGDTTPEQALDVTGNLLVKQTSGNVSAMISGAAETARFLMFQTNGSSRWGLRTSSTAESGSEAGSDFTIYRYDDTGTYLATPLTITRSTGDFSFNNGDFYLDNTNNRVGIGTTSPGEELVLTASDDSYLTAHIVNSSATGNTRLILATAGGDPFVQYYDSNSGTQWSTGFDTADGNRFKISSSPTVGGDPELTITTAGLVGIQTTTPGEELDIAGQIQFDLEGGATDTTVGVCKSVADSTGDESNVEFRDCSGIPSDIAEFYAAEPDLRPGDVVAIETRNDMPTLIKTTSSYQGNVFGIVSTFPVGQFGKPLGTDTIPNDFFPTAIALNGKVPTNVSLENGEIKTGDPLVASSIPGVAMKAVKPGKIIGFALESYDGSTPVSFEVRKQEEYRKQAITKFNLDPNDPEEPSVGKILVIANKTYYDPDIYLTTIGDIELTRLSGENYTLHDKRNNIIDRIGAFKELIAGKIRSGKLETKIISPVQDSDLIVDLQPDNSKAASKFIIKGENDQEVASIDSTGQITANSVQVNNDATVSGTLYADKIESTKLSEIEKLLKDVESSQNLLSQSNNWEIDTASQSADLTAVNLQATNLFVTGQAAITNLLVSENLTAKSLDSLDSVLSIQSLASNPIEIMAGKIKIDTSGNTYFEGNVEIAGDLTIDNLIVATNSISTATPSAEISGNETTSNSIAGKAILPANESDIKINNSKIKTDSLIYITPVSSTQNKVLYVKSKDIGTFTVGFSEPIDTSVEFNWWIIETRGGNI